MNISEIYKQLGELDKKITKKIKKKIISDEDKQNITQKLKEYETLYLELKKNRTKIIKDYEYFNILKEDIKKNKEILIKIKYEIMYDLFTNSDETKEIYTKTENQLNYSNELLIILVKKIKEKETNYVKKMNELNFEIDQKIDEYKYNNDIEDIENKKEIYTRYMELQKNLFLNKNISFNLFEKNDNLRYDLNYRPYTEYNINKIIKSGHINLNNELSNEINESNTYISPEELEELPDNLNEAD